MGIISPSDDRGHSSPLTIRVPPNWINQLDRLIACRLTEHVNRGELVREAIMRYLLHLENTYQSDNALSAIQSMAVMNELIDTDKLMHDFEIILGKLRHRVGRYRDKGASNEAKRLVLKTLSAAERIRNEYWREYFSERIKAEYTMILIAASEEAVKIKPGPG